MLENFLLNSFWQFIPLYVVYTPVSPKAFNVDYDVNDLPHPSYTCRVQSLRSASIEKSKLKTNKEQQV
jgi:hypothetical protein